ncbi:MAG: hypothetical protein WD077_15280 [Bacteroidia bacterium]
MNSIRNASLVLTLLVMLSGCMTMKVVANYDTDNIVPSEKTRVIYLWGILQPNDIPAGCESKSICMVQVKTNIGYIMVSAITVGIVVPQKVVWDCCPSQVDEEHLD